MIAFVDNDVITKLAACDLLDAALSAVGITVGDTFTLPTARFSLWVRRDRHKGEMRYGADTHRRICRFIDQAKTASGEPHPLDMTSLSGTEGIDPGEAVLIALCARTPNSILITGDKRAMRSLAAARGLSEIQSALKGRVYSLERVVTVSIDHLGFDNALPRIIAGCSGDKVLRSIFGSGLKATEASVRDGLRHYEAELSTTTAGLYCE